MLDLLAIKQFVKSKTMKIRQSAIHPAIIVMVSAAIIFIGYWAILPAFAMIDTMFVGEDPYITLYTNSSACGNVSGYWIEGECHRISESAINTTKIIKNGWLALTFIFVTVMLIWLFSTATNRDPTYRERF